MVVFWVVSCKFLEDGNYGPGCPLDLDILDFFFRFLPGFSITF